LNPCTYNLCNIGTTVYIIDNAPAIIEPIGKESRRNKVKIKSIQSGSNSPFIPDIHYPVAAAD
jgi:hypothetical protein